MNATEANRMLRNAIPNETGFDFQWYDKEDMENKNNYPFMIPTEVFSLLTKGELQPMMRIRRYQSKEEAMKDLANAIEYSR